MNLTLGLRIADGLPLPLDVSFDWLHNTGFDLAGIAGRAGATTTEGLRAKVDAYQLRGMFGRPVLTSAGDWHVFAAIRHLERDAWLDGFTDSAWAAGGTNYRGWQIGFNRAFDRHTSVGLRWTSARNLDDGYRFLAVPGDPNSLSGNLSSAPFKVDVLFLDVNARF